jgi:hypothetical protein
METMSGVAYAFASPAPAPTTPQRAPEPEFYPVKPTPAPGRIEREFEWTRSEALALALNDCRTCMGSGLKLARRGKLGPCNCVLRAIFRCCYNRYVKCSTQEKYMSTVSLEAHRGRKRHVWGRKDEEYIADFVLVSRRHLTDQEYACFRMHLLSGFDWKVCAAKLGLNRGNFFHSVYRIEQKLGRVFRELQPYPLFPLDEYFHGASRYQEPVPVTGRAGDEVSRKFPLFPKSGRSDWSN